MFEILLTIKYVWLQTLMLLLLLHIYKISFTAIKYLCISSNIYLLVNQMKTESIIQLNNLFPIK